MAINLTLRMILLTLLPISLCGAALGAEEPGVPPKTVEYKRADTNFYARGDVLKSDPTAVILPPTAFAQNGDTYTYTPRKKAPKILYVATSTDWIEPITPPDPTGALTIAPDAMQIREPQGDVQVALPNAPSMFIPVTDGMALPNGAVVKTGANATAAILFGGVDSARLMPDSEAAVQQTVTATSRSAEVDLTAGGVFAKVGTQLEVASMFQIHTPFGNALAQAGDFAAVATGGRTDVWVAQGTVELLQPDGKKYGVATADGTGPLKLIRFPAIMNSLQALQADAESLTSILNFIPVADQKLAALHAKQARGTPLTPNEQAYVQRIKQVPALIKLALAEPPAPPPPPPLPPTQVITGNTPPGDMQYASMGQTVPGAVVLVQSSGRVKFQDATMGLKEFQARVTAFAAANPDKMVVVSAGAKVPHAKVDAVVNACRAAHVRQVAVVPLAPPAVPPPAAAPAVAATPAPPTAPPQPVTVIVHANGTIKFQGANMGFEEFQARIKALVAAHPDQAVVIRVSPKADYAKFNAIVDACKNAPFKEVAVTPPTPQPPPPAPVAAAPAPAPAVPAPAPAVPATPAAPAQPVNPYVTVIPAETAKPLEPLTALVHQDGSVGFKGKRGSLADFKTRLAAEVLATPDREIEIKTSGPKVPYEHVKAVLDACADAHVAKVNAPPAPQPLPVTAETPPTAPAEPAAPVNNAAVPAAIGLSADGKLTLDATPITEEDLKVKLADIAMTHPKNPLVLMKEPGVTKDQWTPYLELCHSMGLRLLVKNAKPPPPVPRPPAAEGGPIAEPAPAMPTPHLSALPAPQESPPATPAPGAAESVPVEIELTPDGQVSFLGEPVSDAELKSRLEGVAQASPGEPVLIVKDEKVTHDQWQKVVDVCHAARLKVRLKTVKSSDSGALTPPRSPNAAAAVEPPAPGRITSSGVKIVPIEIDIAAEGRITFEGADVDVDQLEARLARFASANPSQPVLIVKKSDVPDDSLEALVTLCRGVNRNFKLSVKTAPDFVPPPPPTSAPAENLPTPAVHMHASMDALNGSP